MKKQTNMFTEQEKVNQVLQDLIQQETKYIAFEAANQVLNEHILEKIAHKMWEKELMSKFKTKYIVKYTLKPDCFLTALVMEKRRDDENLSPKGKPDDFSHPNKTKFGYSHKNMDSLYQWDGTKYEENEAVSFIFVL
jgi:hypothetical protein